jgi:two-component system, response regulator
MKTNEGTVLLAGDDPDHADFVAHTLRCEEFAANIVMARDAEESLDFIFCRGIFAGRTLEHPVRLVLLDLKLSKAGRIEVLRQVKSSPRTKTIPVVVLTSSTEETDLMLMDGYNIGANSYIQKPADREQFRETIKALGTYWLSINQSPTWTAKHTKETGQ